VTTWVFWIPALVTAAVIATLSHQPDLGLPDRFPDWLAHAVEYGFFTLTLIFATSRGFDPRRRTAPRVAAAVAIASLYGITDEWHQRFVGRDMSALDWLADTAGALIMASAALWAWRRMAASQPPV
jgi:VanZ family protein